MRIFNFSAIAILVDIQERIFPVIRNNSGLRDNALKLIKGLQALDIPILVTEQYPKGLGETIPELRNQLKDAYEPYEKRDFSCCGDPAFLNQLRSFAREKVILFGVETHVCVMQTAVDLIEKNFTPVLVEDCCSTRKENDHKIAVERIRNEGGIVTTYESLLMELLSDSARAEFKEISAIIK